MSAPALSTCLWARLSQSAVEDPFQQTPSHRLTRLHGLFFQLLQIPFCKLTHLFQKLFQFVFQGVSQDTFYLLIRFHP